MPVWTKTVQFLSLLLGAILVGAGLAHLFALPNKLDLPAADYLTVQQIYRGWDALGYGFVAALAATLLMAVAVRRRPLALAFALLALLAQGGSLAVFFAYTYPANLATEFWTFLPGNWEEMRLQWEYSQAAGAGLDVLGFLFLILAVLTGPRTSPRS